MAHPLSCRGVNRRSGNILMLVVVSLVGLLGLTGLVIDGGTIMAERRHAQNASDAAAMAAAIDLFQGASPAAARQTALVYAARNGYPNDGKTHTVVVNIPPRSGPNAQNSNCVEVICTEKVITYFINLLRPKPAQVETRGVASWSLHGGPGIAALNFKKRKSFTVAKANLSVTGAPIYVNSSAKKDAAVASAGANVTAQAVKVVGGVKESGHGSFNPDAVTGVAPIADPLAMLPAPSSTGLPSFNAVTASSKKSNGNKPLVLKPGVYNGGIKINGDMDVIMTPGTYIMNGGGFQVETSGSLNGTNVMIYNTGSKTGEHDGDHEEHGEHGDGPSFGGFKLKVDGDFTLDPPNSGPYEGLTLFQDPRNTKSADITLKPDGQLVAGTFYLPNARFHIGGKGNMEGSQIIANRVNIKDKGDITLRYDPKTTAKGIDIALVE